jgi:hypothetical protein
MSRTLLRLDSSLVLRCLYSSVSLIMELELDILKLVLHDTAVTIKYNKYLLHYGEGKLYYHSFIAFILHGS